MAKNKFPNGGHPGRGGGGSQDTEAPGMTKHKNDENHEEGAAEAKERPDAADDEDPEEQAKKEDKKVFEKGIGRAVDRLEKAIEAIAPAASRKGELLAKSQSAGLTSDEEVELAELILAKSDLRERAQAPLETDALHKSIDGTAYLEGMHGGVLEGIGVLADDLAKSAAAQTNFGVAIAESLIDIAGVQDKTSKEVSELKKSFADFVERVTKGRGAPAQTPRSTPAALAAAKERGFVGGGQGAGGVDRMTKSMAMTAIGIALKKGERRIAGRDLKVMTAYLDGESERELPADFEAALREYVPTRGNAA